MKSVRVLAHILYYLSLFAAIIFLLVFAYATLVVLLSFSAAQENLPINIHNGLFEIYYPFTNKAFLLGDYTTPFLVSHLFTLAFYGFFLLCLSRVFHAFRQPRLFTQKGVRQLSLFYLLNLSLPVILLLLMAFFPNELIDFFRISLLHLVIGVFAFFMAAIFKQGLLLQEEQDLIF